MDSNTKTIAPHAPHKGFIASWRSRATLQLFVIGPSCRKKPLRMQVVKPSLCPLESVMANSHSVFIARVLANSAINSLTRINLQLGNRRSNSNLFGYEKQCMLSDSVPF